MVIYLCFLVANVRVRENLIRENVLDLHNNGLSIRQISAQARVSTGFITKVIKEYNENNYSVPRRALSRGGSRGRVEGVATPPLGSFQTCLAIHVYPFFMPKIIL